MILTLVGLAEGLGMVGLLMCPTESLGIVIWCPRCCWESQEGCCFLLFLQTLGRYLGVHLLVMEDLNQTHKGAGELPNWGQAYLQVCGRLSSPRQELSRPPRDGGGGPSCMLRLALTKILNLLQNGVSKTITQGHFREIVLSN